jgi:hypothetical protein
VDPSAGDTSGILQAYEGYLNGAGIATGKFDEITVANDNSQSDGTAAVPTSAQLTQYNTVIWFTADNSNSQGGDPPISTSQETILANWLHGGGKTLVIVSEYLIYVNLGNSWTTAPTDPIFATYLPLNGGEDDPYLYPEDIGSGDNDLTQGDSATFTFTGTSTVSSAFGSLSFSVGPATLVSSYTAGAVNPKTGVDILATVQSDPNETGTKNITTPVVIGKKGAGSTTSNVVYVGVEPLSFQALTGQGTAQEFVNGILQSYAGLP